MSLARLVAPLRLTLAPLASLIASSTGVLLLPAALETAGCDASRTPGSGGSALDRGSAASSADGSGAEAASKPGAASRQAPAAGSASAASAPTSTPTRNDLPPDVREAWSDLVGRDLPEMFSGPDERRFYARCLSFTRALNDEAAEMGRNGQLDGLEQGDPTGPMRAIDAVRSHPPSDMASQDVAWCAEYSLGGLRLEAASRVAEQARGTIHALAGAVVASYGRTGKLCPSSTQPVPEKVQELRDKPYQPKPEDWDAAAWRCLSFRWLRPLRFQLEFRAKANEFTIVARGYPMADAELEEYRLDGTVGDGGVDLGEVRGRYLMTD